MKPPFFIERIWRDFIHGSDMDQYRGWFLTPIVGLLVGYILWLICSNISIDLTNRQEDYNRKTSSVYQQMLHRQPTKDELDTIYNEDNDSIFDKIPVEKKIRETEEYKKLQVK